MENTFPLRKRGGQDRGLWELTEVSVLPQGREERRRASLGDLNDWRRILIVYRTVCTTDCKGRPFHNLEVLGDVVDRSQAVRLMDQDVVEWQTQELDERNANKEEGEDADTEWAGDDEGDVRFEMKRDNPDDPRQFVEKFGDGTLVTTCYHFHQD